MVDLTQTIQIDKPLNSDESTYDLLSKVNISSSGTTVKSQVFTSDGTFTLPTGVSEVIVYMIGAGGGCPASSGGNGKGAGGGGACVGKFKTFSNITVTVGQGVSGSNGEDSVVTNGIKTYTANGGKLGNGTSAGLGGQPNNADGFLNYNGGNGSDNYIVGGFPRGGHGGGSAGCGANGTNATAVENGNGIGGIGLFGEITGGTKGGNGGFSSPTKTQPTLYGGGAYSDYNGFGSYPATTGANGIVIISWLE